MRLSKCKYDAPARIDLGLPNWGGGNQQVVPSPAPPATRLRRGPPRLNLSLDFHRKKHQTWLKKRTMRLAAKKLREADKSCKSRRSYKRARSQISSESRFDSDSYLSREIPRSKLAQTLAPDSQDRSHLHLKQADILPDATVEQEAHRKLQSSESGCTGSASSQGE
jgi:hypothetical protein